MGGLSPLISLVPFYLSQENPKIPNLLSYVIFVVISNCGGVSKCFLTAHNSAE